MVPRARGVVWPRRRRAPETVAPGPPGSTQSRLLIPPMSSGAWSTYGGPTMEPIYPCCAGLDVHKDTVVACLRRIDPAGKARKEVRTFGTMTRDLLELSDWLAGEGVTHVAMESTGVYWKPIFNILEGRFHVLLVNAQHIKQVPGRKTGGVLRNLNRWEADPFTGRPDMLGSPGGH